MKKLVALAVLAVLFVSCGQKKKQKEVAVLTVDEVYVQGGNLADQEIVVTGTVTHVCQHGGERCFLMGLDEDNSLRVEMGEGMSPFTQDQVGTELKVKGILKETRIDKAYLDEWEEEIKTEVEANVEKRHLDGHEKADGDHEDVDVMSQVNDYRKQLAETEKGYISRFFMEGKKVLEK